MAEDDQDRASEKEAEREAETRSEVERTGRDPDRVDEGDDSLGRQSADSGEIRDESERSGGGTGDERSTEESPESDEGE